MAKFKRMLAFLLVLTMMLSMGETLALADGDVLDGTGQDVNNVDPSASPEPSAEPSEEPEPTAEPSASPEPTEEPETEPTAEPSASPEPSADPNATPEPSADPDATPEPSASPEPEHKEWPWTEPGNDVSVLMGGGTYLTSGSSFYSAGSGLYLNDTLLASGSVGNLNLVDGSLYYTTGASVMRMPAGGGSAETVLTAEASIDQMYVMGQEIRYLAGGSLYSFDMNDGAVEPLEAPAGTAKFIPTAYGNLFFTGSWPSYALWAEQTQVASGLENAWTDGEWLAVAVNGETMQTSLPALFQGSYAPQAYSLHQSEVQTVSMFTEEAQLAAENAYYESAEYAAIQARLASSANSGIMTIASGGSQTKALNQTQLNIVQRARQHSEIVWTCQADVCAWGGDDPNYMTQQGPKYIKDTAGKYSSDVSKKYGYFLKGHSYRGVPYAWPIGHGYVDWNVTLQQFFDATKNEKSVFYTKRSTDRTAPYYGSDCSSFVSYAWDLPERGTCTSINRSYSTYIGNDYHKLQVGYAINNPSSHIMLVTDMRYDGNGNIVSVEITDQSPPKMRVSVYGAVIPGSRYDAHYDKVESLQSAYLNYGYAIYARKCSSGVSAAPEVVDVKTETIAAPSISLEPVGPNKVKVTLTHKDSGVTIYYTQTTAPSVTEPTNKSTKYENPFVIESTDAVTINAVAYKDDNAGTVLTKTITHTANEPKLIIKGAADTTGVYKSGNEYYVKEGSELSFLVPDGATVYYSTDGEPTADEQHKVSAETSITAGEGKTVKAFVYNEGSIPGSVTTFNIKIGEMYTVTVDDPFGLVSSKDISDVNGEVNVLHDKEITFQVATEKDGYKLDHVVVDGVDKKPEGDSELEIKLNEDKQNKNHTLKVVVKLEYDDAKNQKQDWILRSMAFVTAKGIMNGKVVNGSTIFDPTAKASRAMFITVLGRYAEYYDSIHDDTNLSKLYVFTSDSTGEYVAASELNRENRVGITNGHDINVRSEPTTKKSNSYTQLQESGMLIHVLGSQMVDGTIWYTVKYKNPKGGSDTGYVCRTDGTKDLLKVCNFNDITSTNVAYCNGWVQWGYINGLVKGYSNAEFGANYAISRQDVCVLLYNFLTEIMGLKLDTSEAQLKTFSDYSKVEKYARPAMAALVNIGVITGSKVDGKDCLQPTAAAQRCHVAKFFMELDNYLNKY